MVADTLSRPSVMMQKISQTQIGTRIHRKEWLCELALWVQGWQSKGDFISISNSCTLCLDSISLTKVLSMFPAARLNVVMYVHGLLQEIGRRGLEPAALNDLWRPMQPID